MFSIPITGTHEKEKQNNGRETVSKIIMQIKSKYKNKSFQDERKLETLF